MLKDVHSTLTEFNMIAPGDKVVAGVSGGADSVALLLMLDEYRKDVVFDLEIVHVNHLIRDDASEDAEFVRNLAEKLGIPFHLFEVDVHKEAERLHLSTEEAGRKVRYEAMRSLNPTKIAVGHHSNDLTETVMLNICRGTGIHGLAGIVPVQDDIIRPLLFVSRKDIENYLGMLCQPYRTDSTNYSDDYTRNKIRRNVIPYLSQEVNAKVSEHIISLSRDMMEAEVLVDRLTEDAFSKICELNKDKAEIVISTDGLSCLDYYIQRELLLKCLEKITPRRKDITRKHITSILDIINKQGEKKLSLPYNLEVISTYSALIIRQKKLMDLEEKEALNNIVIFEADKGSEETEVSILLSDGRKLVVRVFDYDNTCSYPDDRCTKWFDYDKINGSVTLRKRESGDYLVINEKGQKKSLKEYMINEKVPREKRNEQLIIADGNHVMWLIGYRISSYYKIGEQTKHVIEISIK